MTRRLSIAILASGSGTNAQAVIDAAAAGRIPVRVECVISDRATAPVLDRARAAGIDALAWNAREIGRDAFETLVVDELRQRGVQLVVLAGFMRICGPTFLAAYEGRTLNVHPSLLPEFPGADAIGAALEAGVRGTGVTVHWIDSGVDTGPVIAQAAVPVHDGDTREQLAARIQATEHRLLPEVVGRVARARLRPDAWNATDVHARSRFSFSPFQPHHPTAPDTRKAGTFR